ncbi:MAG: protein kinase [Symploca sp. SIO1C2]|nr:protein kinase [Symploca sp. SIO1C2]
MPSTKKKPGELINKRYKILRPLSEGGQGITYIVKDEQSNSHSLYVIKQLQKKDRDSANVKTIDMAIKRFKQEANILKILTQDGVSQIPCYEDYFELDEEYYLVQEFIKGKTLEEILVAVKRLNKFQIIALLQDILNILSCIHSYITPDNNAIYHRDIKPSNLMWQEDKGHIVIIDFGVTKYDNLTLTGYETYGTPPYAASELWEGRVYPSSDIYSLGVTAIEALTGQTTRTISEHYRGMIGDDLAGILEKMIHSRTEERYQSAKEVLDELKTLNAVDNVLRHRYQIIRVINYLDQANINPENWDTETSNHTYIAIDEEDQQKVIIREFSPKSADMQVLQAADKILTEECEKLKDIKGPNMAMPRLLDYFSEDSKFYVVYEIISGNYLSQDIVLNKELQQNWGGQQIIQLLKNLLPTLQLLHTNDCLHLDIKPSKIVTTDQGAVYLTGAARIEEIANLSSNLHGGIKRTTPVGTADYMPPEQSRKNYRPNCDIYSLGITAIQLLTGKDPQTIKTDKTHNNLWSNVKAKIELKRILEKMVDESPIQGRRYQSVQEVIDDLNKLPKPGKSFFIIDIIMKNRIFLLKIIAAIFVLVVGLSIALFPKLQVIIKHNQATDKLDEAEKTNGLTAQTNYTLALEGFNDVIEKKPDFYQARASKAYVMGKLGYPENEIKKECEQILKDEDKFAGAYNCLGALFNKSGKRKINSDREGAKKDFKDAIFYYERAIEFDDPEQYNFNDGMTKPLALYNKGEVYIELKNLETEPQQQLEYCKAAKRSFEEALQAEPKFSAAQREIENIGNCSLQ